MKEITVEITGTSGFLMNRFDVQSMEDQKSGKRISKTYDSAEEAEKSAYWLTNSKKKELMIPSQSLYASIMNASSFYKINKRSAKTILAGSIRITPEEIPLGTDKYTIDRRAVVIQRARVLKSRARLDSWKAKFTIVYNDKIFQSIEILKQILEEAGNRIGIGDFRPAKGGMYGTFVVTKFEPKE